MPENAKSTIGAVAENPAMEKMIGSLFLTRSRFDSKQETVGLEKVGRPRGDFLKMRRLKMRDFYSCFPQSVFHAGMDRDWRYGGAIGSALDLADDFSLPGAVFGLSRGSCCGG